MCNVSIQDIQDGLWIQGKRGTSVIVFTRSFVTVPLSSQILKSRMYYFCAPFHSSAFPQTHFLPSSRSFLLSLLSRLSQVSSVAEGAGPSDVSSHLFPSHPFHNLKHIQIVCYGVSHWPFSEQMTASGQRQSAVTRDAGEECAGSCRENGSTRLVHLQIKRPDEQSHD